MRQIDHESAIHDLPAPAAAGAPGYFTEGDEVAGIPATVVTADFLNLVMMEMVNTVTASGQVPSKTDFGQLLKAIQFYGIKSFNLVQNGHIEFGNGLIINWGYGKQAGNGGSTPVVFDKPFAVGSLARFATNNISGALPPLGFHGTDLGTKVGMTVWSATASGVAAPANIDFYWLALGV